MSSCKAPSDAARPSADIHRRPGLRGLSSLLSMLLCSLGQSELQAIAQTCSWCTTELLTGTVRSLPQWTQDGRASPSAQACAQQRVLCCQQQNAGKGVQSEHKAKTSQQVHSQAAGLSRRHSAPSLARQGCASREDQARVPQGETAAQQACSLTGQQHLCTLRTRVSVSGGRHTL